MKELDTHPCSTGELGLLEDQGPDYYPVYSEQSHVIKLWQKKFKCAKPADYEIWGAYSSEVAQQLAISFKMCTGRPDCHSEADIRDWISGKYIVLVYH